MSKGTKKGKNTKSTVILGWICTILAILLFASVAIMAMEYATPYKPSNGFKRKEEASAPVESGFSIGSVENNGIKLTSAKIAAADYAANGISPQAESAYKLTATIEPVSADDRRVEWSVTCTDESIETEEYVSLTANGLTVTVACLKDFDRQMTVTVKSLDNPSATASCTLDYVERLLGITVNVPKLAAKTLSGITYTTTSSKYTIETEKTLTVGHFCMNAEFKVAFCNEVGADADPDLNMQESGVFWAYPDYESKLLHYNSDGIEFTNVFQDDETIYSIPETQDIMHLDANTIPGCFVSINQNLEHDNGLTEGDVVSAFRAAAEQYALFSIEVTVSSAYNGTNYGVKTETVNVFVDSAALHVSVSNISISQGSLIF